jgi:DNA-binding beta-propeller fold protein YncE
VRSHTALILVGTIVAFTSSTTILPGREVDMHGPALFAQENGRAGPALPAPERAHQEARYRSPFDVAFSPDGGTLAVSDRTAGLLYVIDTATGEVRNAVQLQGNPMALAWRQDNRVVVSEYDASTIAEVDVKAGQVTRRFGVGPKPVGVAIAPKKDLLVVGDYGLHVVLIIDLKTGSERARVPAGKHPYFVAVTPDEQLAVVGNLIPAGPANDPASAAVVSLIDLDRGRKTADVTLPDSSSNVRQVRVSPDGRWAYVVHTRGRTTLPTTQLDRGWVNTNALSIIDLPGKALYATVLLDTIVEGAADPWGIALSADAKIAWISIAGAQQIGRIELGTLHEFLAGRGDIKGLGFQGDYSGPGAIWQQIKEDPSQRGQLSYQLSALYAAGLMSRISIPAQCPRGIALSPDGKQLAVASYYSGEVLLLSPERCQVVKRISLGPQPEPDDARRGEFVFHNGRHSFQHWLSCSTCHPDGRADGLNWDLLNDGIGNPKNARSLLWSHQTPPMMSLGVRENVEEAAQKGFQFIQFREVEQGDLNAVRAYLRSLEPEASPHLVNGRLSEKAVKGKRIFEDPKVGCAGCHPAPLYTSLQTHDVGTRHELDRDSRFDTPTCVELWRTGPYLHDGSATTLQEMLTTLNPNDKHGKTAHLSKAEIDALVEYLLSL